MIAEAIVDAGNNSDGKSGRGGIVWNNSIVFIYDSSHSGVVIMSLGLGGVH